jgi:hypothetical protein
MLKGERLLLKLEKAEELIAQTITLVVKRKRKWDIISSLLRTAT